MKKILLATAAVALTAGAASADVTFSGLARAGVLYNNNNSTGAKSKTTLTDRFRLYLKVNKKTDSGLELGVVQRFQSDAGSAAVPGMTNSQNVLKNGATQIYLQQNGLKIEFGNVDGPIEQMPGVYAPSTGLTGLSYGGMVVNYYDRTGTYHSFDWLANYQGFAAPGTYGNAAGVEINYTMGGLTAMLARGGLSGSGNTSTQGMVSYDFGMVTGAVAYSSGSHDGSQSARVVGTVAGKVGPVDLTLGVASNKPVTAGVKGQSVTKYALNGAYTMGAITMNAYYAHQNNYAPAKDAYGIGAKYDLGGAALQGGVAKSPNGDTVADFGVIFTF
jgi:outer membrane protein OmpU